MFFAKTKPEAVCPVNVRAAIKVIPDPGGDIDHSRQGFTPTIWISRTKLAQYVRIELIHSGTGMLQGGHRLAMLFIQRHRLARRKCSIRHYPYFSNSMIAHSGRHFRLQRKDRMCCEDSTVYRS